MPKKLSIGTGLKKRQAIDKANRTMFLWVAAASVALSVLLVAVQFMYGQMTFNNAVLSEQLKTEDTLNDNIENAKKLKLAITPLNVGDANVSSQKILAALPVDRSSSIFGAAIQNLIAPQSGVQLQSLAFTERESEGDNASADPASGTVLEEDAAGDAVPVTMSLVANGTYASITTFLSALERVTRPISIDTLNLSGSGDNMTLTLQMKTYYQLKKTVEVESKVIKQ